MRIPGLASLIAICVTVMLVLPATAQVTRTPAGPIWHNIDAQHKCPKVCGAAHMEWKGDWRTVRPGESECDCIGRAGGEGHHWTHHFLNILAGGASAGAGGASAGGSGNSCTAPTVKDCGGCSVSCRADQSARCRAGEPWRLSDGCARRAECECR